MVTDKKKERMWFFAFVFPALFCFLVVVVIPFIIGIGYSFVEWNGLAMEKPVFAGFKNYISHDIRFGQSALHTLIFTVLAVILRFF